MNGLAWVDAIRADVASSKFGGKVLFNEPLSKHTYFKIGGPAAVIAVPETEEDLRCLRGWIQDHSAPFFVLGLGSNLLAPDEGLPILFVKTTRLNLSCEKVGDTVKTGAGLSVASFLRAAANEGWDGFEFMSGIPGTLGGVIAMNGGTHLGEAADRILSVDTFRLTGSPEKKTHSADALAFSYRKNRFLESDEIVLSATWKLEQGTSVAVREKLDQLYRRRKETQPLEFPSCGSVFKNPRESGLRAWEVIEKLGLRGHRIGNAQFAEKHPNWILNLGQASAKDVIALIELAKKRAKAELGVEIQEEVRILLPTQ
jgi:UDP-N-acetylmuramate dehydrogenase